jgi:hypothetical protein
MNEKLKTLEHLARLLYEELKAASNDANVCDITHNLLKQAAVDTINLQRKIDEARAWNI